MSRDNGYSGDDEPHFDGEDQYMTRRMHWVAHQGVRQCFQRTETRLDDQFDDVNNNIRGIQQQMVTIQEAINNLGNHRGHHSSSSSSSRTHRSSRHDSSSRSNSRRGEL